MVNLSKKDVTDTCVGVFKDLNATDWGCKYAEVAANVWYITQNTLFRPDDSVTQIEALKMIMNALWLDKVPTDDWRDWYLLWARKQWIINEESFDFDREATRDMIFNIAAKSLWNDWESLRTTAESLVSTQQYKNISWVDANNLSLDIYYNSDIETKRPVVIYVHGGGWAIWDKTSQLDNKVSLFKSLNYIFISVNYRLSPFPYKLRDDDRIKYPIHNEDVASSISWIIKNISSYWGDETKIALMWHSAGAHLVALTGADESFLIDEWLSFDNISGIISIDTEAYDISQQINNWEQQKLFENAFWNNQQQMIQASPMYNISEDKNHPPYFIWKRDTEKTLSSHEDFIQTLKNNSVTVTEIDGSQYSHAEINDAIWNPDDTVITPAIIEFLDEIFQ